MPDPIAVQTNFTAGEFSPRLYGRSDLSKYANGSKEILNFVVQKHGGLIRRSGSRFLAPVKHATKKTRLLRFKFSNQQNYALEFGDLYVRFFRDRGRLQHGTVYDVSNASYDAPSQTATLTITPHDFQVGDIISVQEVLIASTALQRVYNGTFTITAITATTVSYILTTTPPAIYLIGGKVRETTGNIPTEIASVYTEADLALLKITQSNDVLYIAHPSYEPRLLSRGSGSDSDPLIWSFAALDARDGPYLPTNTNAAATINVVAGSAGDTRTLTANSTAVTLINGGRGFLSTDVGRVVRFRIAADNRWTWGEIAAILGTADVSVLLKNNTVGGGTDLWRMGAWSNTTGWPFCARFHEDRLWFGGTNTQPQTFWGSVVGDYTNFVPDDLGLASSPSGVVLDTSAITMTILSKFQNTIHFLESDARGLIVSTDGGVFLAEATEENTITPTNIHVVPHVAESGSQLAPPQQVSGVTLLVMSADRKVRELVYRVEADRFLAPDLTIISEHVTLSGIIDTALQLEPDSLLWTVRNDGMAACGTYEMEEDVIAWHRHQLGGTLDGEPYPAIESVCVLRDGGDDLVYLIAKRTINGLTARYVEFLEALFPDDATVEDAFYVDSGLTLSNPKTITGATQSLPVFVTAPDHGFVNGDRVRIRGVKGMTEINDLTFIVGASSANTFALTDINDGSLIDGSEYGAYVSGGGAYKEVEQVSGLDHLVGETVQVLVDGGTHPDRVVSASGLIELEEPASIIHVGLGFVSRVETLPLVVRSIIDGRGRLVRVDHVVLRFNRTVGGSVGSPERMDPIEWRSAAETMGNALPLASESIRRDVSASHSFDPTIVVEANQPLPMNLLSIIAEAGVNEV